MTLVVAYSAQQAVDKIRYENTKKTLDNVHVAINAFAQKANRLPCPAKIGLAKTDPDYGKENCVGKNRFLF
jgi:ribosomal protein S11